MKIIEIAYLLAFIAAIFIRKYFTAKFKPEKEQLKESSFLDKLFLGLMGVTMLLPVIKIWVDFFPFANYNSMIFWQWAGIMIFLTGIYLLYRSHVDLGKNWNPEVAINMEQNIVITGIYAKIRHPMYTAHILWSLGNTLIFANWIIGPSMLFILIFFLPQRISREEKVLIDQFGKQYIDYMKTTKPLFPFF